MVIGAVVLGLGAVLYSSIDPPEGTAGTFHPVSCSPTKGSRNATFWNCAGTFSPASGPELPGPAVYGQPFFEPLTGPARAVRPTGDPGTVWPPDDDGGLLNRLTCLAALAGLAVFLVFAANDGRWLGKPRDRGLRRRIADWFAMPGAGK